MRVRRSVCGTRLAELEGSLLVWHTYRPDGSRWLFIPAEIRSPHPARLDDLPPLTPVLVPPAEDLPWRPPFALAWDLLTLLREFATEGAPRVHDAADLPRSWRRRLNRGLWQRGSDLPPVGYVEFLADLARAEEIVRGGAEVGQEPLTLDPAIRLWRDRSFADQMERLRRQWLASQSWIEGVAREDVDVWGAEWVLFRRKLLVHLAALAGEHWYALEDLAAWLAARDPEMLGATFTVATARRVEPTGGDTGRRRAAIAEVVAVTLETAFRWFGLVEAAESGRTVRLVRLTDAGRALANAQPSPAEERSIDGPPLVVAPAGVIELREPTPLRVWSLAAFADVERLERVSTYRLTGDSVARALNAGFEVRQILSFLATQSATPVPAEVKRQLDEWTQGFRRVRLRRAVVVTPEDASLLAALTEAVASQGLAARVFDDALLILLPASGIEDQESQLSTTLREAGFTPQWDARGLKARRPDDSRSQTGTDPAARPGRGTRSTS